MPKSFGVGASVRRVEDPRLLTGGGRYLSDIIPQGAVRGYFVRSSVAHARFRILNVDEVRGVPGVLDVLTYNEIRDVLPLPSIAPLSSGPVDDFQTPPFPVLADEHVRFVGDAIAFVVATSEIAARDAAELLQIETDDLPAVVDLAAAVEPGAPIVWPSHPGNLAFRSEFGSKAETDAAFEKASEIVRLRIVNNRLVANYMEPRGALAEYDPAGSWKLTLSVQAPHRVRDRLAQILNVGPDKIRVVVPDVGGGFGTRYFAYREYAVIAVAAQRLGRAVAWISDRSEHFVCDYHGRDHVSVAELAIGPDQRFLGLRVDTYCAMGAYLAQYAPFVPTKGALMTTGVYDIPAVHIVVKGAFTNTVPLDAYRGAGRPEATFLIERLVDAAASRLKMAPAELRRLNFIPESRMPFTTATGHVYDSGNFAQTLDAALALADAAGFEERREATESAGRLRGLGIATYIEASAEGWPEYATVRLEPDGSVTILIGTQDTGQGHRTAFAQLACEVLNLPFDQIRLVEGDTAQIPLGTGTSGSRSIPIGGSAVRLSSVALAEKIREEAAQIHETSPLDIELVEGQARVVGTNKTVSFAAVARHAADRGETLATMESFKPPAPNYPNGTHIVEVEIDPETGVTEVSRYVVVDDFGVVLNPMLLDGQVHGGIVQGIGQALFERTVYDNESGQLLSASLLDYAVPRADTVCSFVVETRNTLCRTNPLGIKGAGESGTIAATPAVANAVIDALRHAYGIEHLDIPLTPASVWQAIQHARMQSEKGP